jgi:hypothetical protein
MNERENNNGLDMTSLLNILESTIILRIINHVKLDLGVFK